MVVEEASFTALNVCESSGLYYLARRVVFKELKTLTCDACIKAIRVQHVSSGQFSESLYTRLKSYDCKGNLENNVSVNIYSTNFLCHPSRNVLQLLNNAEVVFRSNSLKMMNIHGPLDFLMMKVCNQNSSISNCHHVGAKILKRYLRLHIHARHINCNFNQEKQFAGKSAVPFSGVKRM